LKCPDDTAFLVRRCTGDLSRAEPIGNLAELTDPLNDLTITATEMPTSAVAGVRPWPRYVPWLIGAGAVAGALALFSPGFWQRSTSAPVATESLAVATPEPAAVSAPKQTAPTPEAKPEPTAIAAAPASPGAPSAEKLAAIPAVAETPPATAPKPAALEPERAALTKPEAAPENTDLPPSHNRTSTRVPAVAANLSPRLSRMPLMRWQRMLNQLGFEAGRLDGVMGPLTEGAVRAFQKSETLEETGVTDVITATRLRARVKAKASNNSAPE
jgi:pyruvate/2-oxoglutarate dehydrogenase complex dihydrolipoamide acyltransferase (E2) component